MRLHRGAPRLLALNPKPETLNPNESTEGVGCRAQGQGLGELGVPLRISGLGFRLYLESPF